MRRRTAYVMGAAALCVLFPAQLSAFELLTDQELTLVRGGPGIVDSNCSAEDSYAECQYDNGGDCPQILNCQHGHAWEDSMEKYRKKITGNQVVFMREKPTCRKCDCTRDANPPWLCQRTGEWRLAEPKPIHCSLQQ